MNRVLLWAVLLMVLGGCQHRPSIRPQFENVTLEAGLYDLNSAWGVSWVDYDQDGNLDLYVSNHLHRPSVMYHNRGDGTFREARELDIDVGDDDHSSAWGDLNNDGFPDLFSTSGVHQPDFLHLNQSGKSFRDVTESLGVDHGSNGRGRSSLWADLDNDGRLDLFVVNWITPNLLYLNRDGKLVEVGREQGLNSYLAEVGAAASDIDSDGDLDLYLAVHDHRAANKLYLNLGGGRFREAAAQQGLDVRGNSYHAAFADYDNDGDPDLVVSQNVGNTLRLLRNRGDGTFEEVTEQAGMLGLSSTHASWADVDNDGHLDLCLAVGGNRDEANRPLVLLQNKGDGSFQNATEVFGLGGTTKGVVESTAWGDYNNDGFLDLVVSNGGGSVEPFGPHLLYRNRGNDNHWLKLQLIGTRSNRDGLGARVLVHTGTRTQMREAFPYNGMAQNSHLLHFGLGSADRVDRIEVRWPSGVVQWIHQVPADRTLTVLESSGSELVHSPPDLLLEESHRLACQPLLERLERQLSPPPAAVRPNPLLAAQAICQRRADQVSITPEDIRAYYTEHQDRYRTPFQVWVDDIAIGEFHSEVQDDPARYQEKVELARELLLQGLDALEVAHRIDIRVWQKMWGKEPDHSVRGYLSEGYLSESMARERYGEAVAFYLLKSRPGQVLGPYPLQEAPSVIPPELVPTVLHLFRTGPSRPAGPVPLSLFAGDIERKLRSRAANPLSTADFAAPPARGFYLPTSRSSREQLSQAVEHGALKAPQLEPALRFQAREQAVNSAFLDSLGNQGPPEPTEPDTVELLEMDHVHIADPKLADRFAKALRQGATFEKASRALAIPVLWEREARRPASNQLYRMISVFSEARLESEFPNQDILRKLDQPFLELRYPDGTDFLQKRPGKTERPHVRAALQPARPSPKAWLTRAEDLVSQVR